MGRHRKSEIRSLTGLRGVAALIVVFFHFASGQKFANPVANFIIHGYVAVDIFFVLSGFVMALSYRHMFAGAFSRAAYGKFLGRRVARVYPLYVAATLCAMPLIHAGVVDYRHNGPLWTAVIENFSMVQAWGLNPSFDGPGWSISAEFAAYLLFPILLVPTLLRRSWCAWLTGFVALAAVGLLCLAPSSVFPRTLPGALLNLPYPKFGISVWRCIPEFTMGLVAFRMSQTKAGRFLSSRRWPATAICVAFGALMCTPRTDWAIVALVPFLIVSIASGNQLPTRILASSPLEFLGRISYSIYLVHDLFVGLVNGTAATLAHHGMRHTQTAGAVVGIAASGMVAMLAYKTIEVPGREWVRSMFEGEWVKTPAVLVRELQSELGEA